MIAAAAADRIGSPLPPTSAPIPTTIPTYTALMTTAIVPYRSARLITTSMSKRW
jgi:hypothetical protein